MWRLRNFRFKAANRSRSDIKRSATGKRSLRSKSLTGRRSCLFRRTGVCLHRTGSGGNRKKSKLIFDSLQTRDRRGWLKNGNQPGDPQVAPRCGAKTRRGNGCSGAGHAERSMSDARGHKHRPANGRRAGAVPHGEAKAWLVRQGRGGRKEANPRTTSV